MRNRKSGFTLMEVMMVISIISITFAAIPAFQSWMPILRTNATTRGLASDLRLARSEAVDRNHNIVVTFDLSANSYSLFSDADNDGPDISDLEKTVSLSSLGPGVLFASTSDYAVGGGAISSAVSLSAPTDPPMIVFKSSGEALHPGSIYLISARDMSPGSRDRNRAVQVLNTGNVKTWRWNANTPTNPWMEWY
jgi:prepilin-type N-terminal cleavage/methylation domain-containing protein